MNAMESISGSLSADRVETFLWSAVTIFGGYWDADQIVAEVVPMTYRHTGPAKRAHVAVSLYPEHRLLVRLDDERTGDMLQEWEYVATEALVQPGA